MALYEIYVTEPEGDDYLFGLSPDLTVEGITVEHPDRNFAYEDADSTVPIQLGETYRIFHRRIDEEFTLVNSVLVTVRDEVGGNGLSKPALEALIDEQTSSDTAEGWVLVQTEGGLLKRPLSTIGSGVGSVTPTADPLNNAAIIGYKTGSATYHTLTDPQIRSRILTEAGLRGLAATFPEATSTEALNALIGLGSSGMFRVPPGLLGNGMGGGTQTYWRNGPPVNYTTSPNAARYYIIGDLPATTTESSTIIYLVGGPNSRVGGESAHTLVTVPIYTQGGIYVPHTVTGLNAHVGIQIYRNADTGRHQVVLHYVGSGVIRAAVAGHSAGGILDFAMTPVIGARPGGTLVFDSLDTTNYPPIWHTKPDSQHTNLPLDVANLVKMFRAFLQRPEPLTAGEEWDFAARVRSDGELKVPADQRIIEKLGSLGFLRVTETADGKLGPVFNKAIPDRVGAVGVALSVAIPPDTFVAGNPAGNPLSYVVLSLLPAGMSYNAGTGTIAGTPTVSGTFPITVGVTDALSQSAFTTFTITILPVSNAAPIPPRVGTIQVFRNTAAVIDLPPFTDPEGETLTYGATSNSGGVSFNAATRQLSVNAPTLGDFTVQYSASDGVNTAVDTITLRVITAGTQLTLLPPLYDCATRRITLQTEGGNGTAKTYSIIGVTPATSSPGPFEVPAGIVNDPNSQPLPIRVEQSGVVVTGTFDFRAYCSATPTLPAPVSPGYAPITYVANSSFIYVFAPFTITGSTITNYAVSGLPPGVSVDLMTRGISGTPTTPGTYPVTITAFAANGTQASDTLTIAVVAQAVSNRIEAIDVAVVAGANPVTPNGPPYDLNAWVKVAVKEAIEWRWDFYDTNTGDFVNGGWSSVGISETTEAYQFKIVRANISTRQRFAVRIKGRTEIQVIEFSPPFPALMPRQSLYTVGAGGGSGIVQANGFGSTDPTKLSVVALSAGNGLCTLANTASPGGGFYRINGQGEVPLTRTDLSGQFPVGQPIMVEWFQNNTPGDGNPEAVQLIALYI